MEAGAGKDLDSFCDPYCPSQRAAATRTPTGRLRQRSRGTDLSLRGPGILANVADELINRPQSASGSPSGDALTRRMSTLSNPGVARPP